MKPLHRPARRRPCTARCELALQDAAVLGKIMSGCGGHDDQIDVAALRPPQRARGGRPRGRGRSPARRRPRRGAGRCPTARGSTRRWCRRDSRARGCHDPRRQVAAGPEMRVHVMPHPPAWRSSARDVRQHAAACFVGRALDGDANDTASAEPWLFTTMPFRPSSVARCTCGDPCAA